jgi:hypothetical protein
MKSNHYRALLLLLLAGLIIRGFIQPASSGDF